VLGLPYAAVVAVLVFLLGLIPLIGATIGAVLVVLVGFTDSGRSPSGWGSTTSSTSRSRTT
jgi:predicted PurR-regulated permease PerM